MTAPALDRLRGLKGFRACGKDQYEACCPAHDDRKASLSIGVGDSKILLHCHAGCELEQILEAAGLEKKDLFPSNGNGNGNGHHARRIVATYDYCDIAGNLSYQVVRYEPKDFRQRRPDGNGGWIWKASDLKRLLYNLPELVEAAYVWIVEGEKDVESLRKIGLTATCIAGGAKSPDWPAVSHYFRQDQHVTIIPDNDEPGEAYARNAASALYGKVASVKILRLEGLPEKGDVSDWLQGRDPIAAAEELCRLADAAPEWKPELIDAARDPASGQAVSIDDFYYYSPMNNCINSLTRDLWPNASVDARMKVIGADGKPMRASTWLCNHRAVEQMTWAPGEPMIIEDRIISDGGFIPRAGYKIFNLYRPPQETKGDPSKATRWLDHVRKVYPGDADHIVKWLAQRVQHPQIKINHALVLGGMQGIGKDTILEPVKRAVGPWNFCEVSPTHLLGRFNGFVRSVILRISEARDLGEVDRFAFYDHLKAYTAAPPDVLRCDEKNIREYAVLNVCGVVITTNHKTDGIYLPADDRRHYVAWSDLSRDDFLPTYWADLYGWYESEGYGHVAAYLREVDLSSFDPKAPPPKTDAFWAIVDASRAPEDAELSDALEALGLPDALTISDIEGVSRGDFAEWIRDRRNRRQIPHRMEAAGYMVVRNNTAKDGLWKIAGKRQVIYSRRDLAARDRIAAAMALTRGGW